MDAGDPPVRSTLGDGSACNQPNRNNTKNPLFWGAELFVHFPDAILSKPKLYTGYGERGTDGAHRAGSRAVGSSSGDLDETVNLVDPGSSQRAASADEGKEGHT